MRPILAGTALILLALVGCEASTGPPAIELNQQEAQIWRHRTGAQGAVHVNGMEYGAPSGHKSVEVKVVVSDQGKVESAQIVGDASGYAEEVKRVEIARAFKPWVRNGVAIRVKIQDEVSLLPPEQWATQRENFPEPWDLKGVEIGLIRTGCFGSCPDYSVTINGDGTVRFSGRLYVLVPGDHVAHIPADTVRELVRQFEAANFFSAKDQYISNWTDNPSQTLTLTVSGREKAVVDYIGTDEGMPQAIRDLERGIDDAAGTARWVEGNDQTLSSLEEEQWPFTARTKQNLAVYTTAISKKNSQLVEHYLAAGGPIFSPNQDEDSPVCVASGMGDLGLVKRMLKNANSSRHETRQQAVLPSQVLSECLSRAARNGNMDTVQFWLDKGADPNATPIQREDEGPGLSVLANGIESGNPQVVRTLLEHRAKVQPFVGGDKDNPEPLLTFALDCGDREGGKQRAEIVEMLIKAGADVNARGRIGQTPIFFATFTPEAVKPLLAARANLEARDAFGATALIRNAYSEPIVRELLEDGANPAAADSSGNTPLKVAQKANFCKGCAQLIEEALKKRAETGTVTTSAP